MLNASDVDVPMVLVTAYHDEPFLQIDAMKPFLVVSKPDSFGRLASNLSALKEFDRQLIQAVRTSIAFRELSQKVKAAADMLHHHPRIGSP